MSQQPSLYTFFSKSPSLKTNRPSTKKNSGKLKLKGKDVKLYDLVWAKLDGYPWWPALVCDNPGDHTFIRNNKIHVQFFDNPPTRGWVQEIFVKNYGPPGEVGVPTYKDPAWVTAKSEADSASHLKPSDRTSLLVEMLPSDEDMEDEDESDESKENIEVISPKDKKHRKEKGKEEPLNKRRRIVFISDSEASEDDYKPGNEESEDDSVSSGVDENESEILTESEPESPVKVTNKRKRMATHTPNPASNGNAISEGTKSRLSLFAAKECPPVPVEDTQDWPHTKLEWLKAENMRDSEKRRSGHPDYDPRTLYVPTDFLLKQTPAMQQWWGLKSHHFDTVLFFKMGKFYELFHMDAVIGVEHLGLIMMKGEAAHSGFPEIAYGRYSSTLIDKGYKVARIEQTETPDMMEQRCRQMTRPKKSDKVVRREICQISSRGTRVNTVMDGEAPDAATAYLLAVTEKGLHGPGDGSEFGVAFIDTSIGNFYLGQFSDDRHLSRLRTLMAHYPPAQILFERGKLSVKTQQVIKAMVPENLQESLVPEKEFWTASKTLQFLAENDYFRKDGELIWPRLFKEVIDPSDSLGLSSHPEKELGLSALGAIVWYLKHCCLDHQLLTQQNFEFYKPFDMDNKCGAEKSHVPAFISGRHHMILDGTTLHNLEIFENSSGGTQGTLMEQLNHCSTAFGKRLLFKWLCGPLCNPSSINSRLDAIEDLIANSDVIQTVMPLLKTLPDLERLLSKIHSQGLRHESDHPDSRAIFFEDKQYSKRKVTNLLSAVTGFRTCLSIIKEFEGVYGNFKSSLLCQCVTHVQLGGKFPHLKEILVFFDNAFDHESAKREGKIIPSHGVDVEYDDAIDKIRETKSQLDVYLKEQCKHFGGKVVYWGTDKKRYQLEVPEHIARQAGDDYQLVSQKKGFKRFSTAKTRDLLADMIAAEEQRDTALKDIARRIFSQFDEHREKWIAAVDCLAVLDVLLSFSYFSQQMNTVHPCVTTPNAEVTPFIDIRDGCHPCVIKTFSGDDFIPNDLVMGGNNSDAHSHLVIVTGPNMGGKSTLMRQTALICILAQLGCFVPATSCKLTPIDRVFTRLGAWDRIMLGESTFFVEMAETSSIIKHATSHSLVLVDELGRGTATYDGTAIASAVVSALIDIGSRTLFSTHYHSLVDDFSGSTNVSLGHMACMVEGENEDDPSQETITFLYKFTSGACPKSYGFNAARLAALPETVIKLGSQKAREFENTNKKRKTFSTFFQNHESLRRAVESVCS